MNPNCLKIKRHLLSAIGFLFFLNNIFGQIDTTLKKQPIDLSNYIVSIGNHNLSYAAEKFNLNIAEAQIELAKIFPDPILNLYGFNNGQQRLQTGYGVNLGITRTIELGGKRKARINLANSENEFTKALLEDFFRNLRADATIDFLQALKQERIVYVTYNSYTNMRQLADADQKRYELGIIMEIDAVQSKVEAEVLLNELFQSEADFRSALLQLSLWLGKKQKDTLYYPIGDMKNSKRDFDLATLILNAQNNRADLLAALKNKEVAERTLKLARANRVADIDILFNNMYVSRISNIIEPTPSYNSTSAGIAMPLRFSNKYRGDLKIAETQIKQADLQYQYIELRIEIEVTQAYNQYLAARKQVEQFDLGLLQQSKKVLDGKIFSYRRGETSLLEVLNAQRTYNGIQLSYYQTLFNYSTALIELERAAGIWDINF